VPKSYQLVIYIFQTAYQELALIGQKVTEKMSAKASYQEILAEFVEGAKQSPAQWYSLKPLQNGIPSLADLLEVSSENLHIIFKNAGLGKLGQRDKMFSFQPSNFESFRSEFMIQNACETTRRSVKGLKSKQWFVRLGTMYYGDLCDPGTNGRAPRVHNIRSLRKDFKDTVSVLATQQQAVASRPEEEEKECDERDIEEDPHESDLVLLRVQRMLLPLLLKDEILQKDFWASDVDSAAVGAALHLIVTELRQHRDDSLSAILATVQAPTSPNTKESPSVVPTLKAYGVSLDDRRVHENLLRDLYVLNKKHSKSNTLYCSIRPNMISSFVHVPFSKGIVRMKKNARKTKWVPDMLTALGGGRK
jgi:hypothetical protein